MTFYYLQSRFSRVSISFFSIISSVMGDENSFDSPKTSFRNLSDFDSDEDPSFDFQCFYRDEQKIHKAKNLLRRISCSTAQG